MAEDGSVTRDNPPTEAYDELSLAADLKWDQKTFFAQAEAILNQRAYEEGARPVANPALSGPSGYVPDHTRYGGYLLLGYRTPFWNVTPFIGGEYNRWGLHFPVPDVVPLWVGLNVRPTPRVVWKVSHTYAFFPTKTETEVEFKPLQFFSAQIAWSF